MPKLEPISSEATISQPSTEDVSEKRENWSSRWVFLLAAIGSAVGLGNLWRFPWQCANWGGGSFILAYLICLITIGMPLMTQELTLGQKHRSGDIEAFGKMNWRLRGIGLASIFGAYAIVTYYITIIGMSLVLFFDSFKKTLPYGDPNNAEYAFNNIWFLAESIQETKGIIGGRLFLCTTLAWIIVFICVNNGVKTASIAVKITMPLPIILLIVLLIHGLTLDGAWEGVKSQYLNFSDWSKLADIELWNAAIGQCFFSLGVCLGVMTAFASYNPVDQNIAADEKIISLVDLFVSLLSGFVVYSVLGYLVNQTGNTDYYESASFGLVFVTYPLAIASFKHAHFIGIIFFLCLFLLGIDSAFSLVEAVSTVIHDSNLNKHYLNNMSRIKISAILCFVGAFLSSLYCWDTGLYWLDIIDRYINNYGMVFLGICETFAAGWFYSTSVQIDKVGQKSVLVYRCGYIFSVLLLCILGFGLTKAEKNSEGVWIFYGLFNNKSWLFAALLSFTSWISFSLFSYYIRTDKELSIKQSIWYIMGWPNIEILRDFINNIADKNWDNIKLTFEGELTAAFHHGLVGIWWGFWIKYFIPTILTLNLIGVMRNETFNNYGGYEWRHLIVGILIFSTMVLSVFIIAFRPQLMTRNHDIGDNINGTVSSPIVTTYKSNNNSENLDDKIDVDVDNSEKIDNINTVGDADNNEVNKLLSVN